MTLEDRPLGALNGTDGIQLTIEETLMLRAVWSTAARVDWTLYDALRLRVLAWPSLVSPEADESTAVTAVTAVTADLIPA